MVGILKTWRNFGEQFDWYDTRKKLGPAIKFCDNTGRLKIVTTLKTFRSRGDGIMMRFDPTYSHILALKCLPKNSPTAMECRKHKSRKMTTNMFGASRRLCAVAQQRGQRPPRTTGTRTSRWRMPTSRRRQVRDRRPSRCLCSHTTRPEAARGGAGNGFRLTCPTGTWRPWPATALLFKQRRRTSRKCREDRPAIVARLETATITMITAPAPTPLAINASAAFTATRIVVSNVSKIFKV